MNKKNVLQYLIIFMALAFLLLVLLISLRPSLAFDLRFSREVQEHNSAFLDSLMKGISWFGYMPVPLILVGGSAVFFYLFRYKREAVFILLTLLSGLVSTLLKLLVNRPRPEASLVRILGENAQQSFPSGHVMFYVVFFGFLSFLAYRLKNMPMTLRAGIIFLSCFLVITVSVSRIYLGAHWFTDILGGYLAGFICLYLLCKMYLRGK
ncbi:MAG: phosphatase PAP2 family protein [Chitinophagaceae bacterium]